MGYRLSPPLYSDAIWRDSSWISTRVKLASYSPLFCHILSERRVNRSLNSPSHSSVGAALGRSLTWMSMKFSRSPRLHSRLLLRQLLQSGTASSHLRWRSRHVRQPVRTRLAFELPAVGLIEEPCSVLGSQPALLTVRECVGVCRRALGNPFRFAGTTLDRTPEGWLVGLGAVSDEARSASSGYADSRRSRV
jgi:hypothetical protein